ncbi:MAG: beta-lactamase family protein [Gammaproteobacteria bacterium]|nr:beta-lactamase family protein [Gammaproteobacteria bacterium]
MTQMMDTFPAAPQAQVTLDNWRQAPFSRWGFQHVREIVPSAEISNRPDGVAPLEEKPIDLMSVQMAHPEAGTIPLEAYLQSSDTDGLVVLRGGAVVTECYANGMKPDSPHILMSVSKSLLGLLAGALEHKGLLDPELLVVDLVPELASTAYAGATIRQLLDMRAGIHFLEDYELTSGPIIEYRKATNWNPLGPGEEATDLRRFFLTLTENDGPHGGRFHYVSPNTDLLAWVMERATGRRYADLLSEMVWKPLGAQTSAYITVDRLGAPRAAGGVCTSLRDLARVGQLLVNGGKGADGQIVERAWVDDLAIAADLDAWQQGDFQPLLSDYSVRYRNKWYVLDHTPNPAESTLFGIGIHGQNVFVDRANDIVMAKFSSQAIALDATGLSATIEAYLAVRERLLAA